MSSPSSLDQEYHSESMMSGHGFSVPFLRRAFSIGRLMVNAQGVEISILFRVVGLGTNWLSQLRQGDELSILGPLGRGFSKAEASSRVVLVAGGVGLPPLAWYGRRVIEAGGRVVGILGARSCDLVALYEGSKVETLDALSGSMETEADAQYPRWLVATDDGSAGFHGNTVTALGELFSRYERELSQWTVVTCGPDRMMHGVASLCADRAMICFVCLEREMACGTGTCQSCAVAVLDEASSGGWRYKLCCKDGPVFNAAEVRW